MAILQNFVWYRPPDDARSPGTAYTVLYENEDPPKHTVLESVLGILLLDTTRFMSI